MDQLGAKTDAELSALARSDAAADADPTEIERVEVFAARYGEAALALYPLVWDMVAGAHADCLIPEATDAKAEGGRCWAVEEVALNRVERALGMRD
jgi:hypothetical protein